MNQRDRRAGFAGEAPVRRSARQGRWLRMVGVAVTLALLIVAAVVLPGWIPLLPRAVRRRVTEYLLRGVLLAYTSLLVAGLIGVPLMTGLMIRSRRQGRQRRAVDRLFLLCLSCLFSWVALEVGSAACRAWMHRFPALPRVFPRSDPEEYRIVVLGGSSAMGEPYRPTLSVGQIVTRKLQEAIPSRRFTLEILAYLGHSLEQQHQKLSTITRRPDAMIIYAGHNEFTARFEENRASTLAEVPRFGLLQAVYRASLRSPFCRLVYELVSKNRLDSPPLLNGRHGLIDPPLCSPSESAEVLADFGARLEALTGYCQQMGILPILIIPPANEGGFEPSRSSVPAATTPADRDRLVRQVEEARRAEADRPDLSLSLYQQILDRHPGFAEAHFRLARLLQREHRIDEARHHYSEALENDGLPIRCPAPLRAAYSQVAARHPGCILIDGRVELMNVSPTGLLDDQVIEDAHHPNFKGYVALASAVLRELQRKKTLGDDLRLDLPLDPAVCWSDFQMDSAQLATACERTSVHYQRVSGYRYDPEERLQKSRQFAEAARQLRAGASSDEVGLPWVGF